MNIEILEKQIKNHMYNNITAIPAIIETWILCQDSSKENIKKALNKVVQKKWQLSIKRDLESAIANL